MRELAIVMMVLLSILFIAIIWEIIASKGKMSHRYIPKRPKIKIRKKIIIVKH